MVEQVLINDDDYYVPDANELITEDDTLDNFATSKQKRLLIAVKTQKTLRLCMSKKILRTRATYKLIYTMPNFL